MYVLQLMDYYSAGFCVLIIAIIECFVVNWIYGLSHVYCHCSYVSDCQDFCFWCIDVLKRTLILLTAFSALPSVL